jgi:Lrp/AsnC family transcriptional regulator, regulator for asnA, asnC and gidA
MSVSVQLDDLDIGIIRLLAKDGRMSFTEIAGQLGVTEKTVRSRFNSLRENNIINVVGVVDPISLGLKTGAIILLGVDPEKLEAVIEAAHQFKEIRFITLISGEYQLLVQVHVRTSDELTEFFKDKLMRIPGLVKTNIIIQLEVYKNTYEYL